MAAKFSTGYRNTILNNKGWKEIFDSGVIDLYSGSQPATADDAATGTWLARVTLNGDAFTEGVSTNGLVWDTPASGAIAKPAAANWKYTGLAPGGTIGWGRLRANAADSGSSTTLPRIDFAVGVTTGELRVTVVDVAAGTPGVVQSATYSLPAA